MALTITRPEIVETTTRPDADDEIEFVDNLDTVAGNEVMRGCGDDNPY
ncbi:hypothetical protein [Streptomyces diacarni]|nr:hypothetical protein [Streptomyces diacarni]